MGERTFSSDDILRIFEDHLDEEEQELVRSFFTTPTDIDRAILERLLRLLQDFVQIFTTPLIGLAISVLPQVVSNAYNELVGEFSGVTRGIDRELGRIDA